ncbi:MAG TPA: FAD binding domain-containing protein [Spirochaetia bacterium]|nr:FAD binding domain-containing protein [Spirochaetia bacterium]
MVGRSRPRASEPGASEPGAYRPRDLDEALAIRSRVPVIPFAGGTDLMVKMKNRGGLPPHFEKPALFIAHLEELGRIEPEGQIVKIGPACTLTALLESPHIPLPLKEAIAGIGSPAIRNAATMGGNICNASPAGDTLPVLYALNASLVLAGRGARRVVPIEAFITAPGRTILREDELVVSIRVPVRSFPLAAYRKVGTRRANALAKLSFVALAGIAQSELSARRVRDLRIALGAVAPTVVRSRVIEESMIGKTAFELSNLLDEVVGRYEDLINPIDDQRSSAAYRKAVSLRLVEHFLKQTLIPSLTDT